MSTSHPAPKAALRRLLLGPLQKRNWASHIHPVRVWLPELVAGTVSRGVSEPFGVCRAVVEGLWLRYQGVPVEEDLGRERRRRVLQTLVWFMLTLLLALFIPDIGKVISVIGGLAACFIFVFPGVDPWRPHSTDSLPPQLLTCSPAGERNHQHVLSPSTGSGLTHVQASSKKKMLFSPLK